MIGANVVFGCMTDIVSKPVVMVRQLIAKMPCLAILSEKIVDHVSYLDRSLHLNDAL